MNWRPFHDEDDSWRGRPERPSHPFHPANRIRGLLGPGAGFRGFGEAGGAIPASHVPGRRRSRARRRGRSDGKRSLLERLSGPVSSRGLYPRIQLAVEGLPPIDRPAEFRVDPIPWPQELDLPIFSVADPEPDRPAPSATRPPSQVRRAALVDRARLLAQAVGADATVLFAPFVGVRVSVDGSTARFDHRVRARDAEAERRGPVAREDPDRRSAAARRLRALRRLGVRRPDRE